MMRRKLLPVSIGVVLSSGGVSAQTSSLNTPPPVDASVPITYVGSNARVSLGIDDRGDVLGEILGILGKTDERAWLADLWLGQGGSGGLQIDYHWLRGSAADAIAHPDKANVWKVFAAGDQNQWKDRKATVGLGWEKNDFSIDAYLMKSTTGSRLIGATEISNTILLDGIDSRGEYTQTQTIDTLTQTFEHPYDSGIGARVSKYLDAPLLRITGGVDYERGKYASDQWTLSLGLDKYFANTGFSISLVGEALRKSGRFENAIGLDRNDARAWVLLRYDIGQNYRAREPSRMVQVERPSPPESTQPRQPQVMRNEVKLNGDAFFDFDSYRLRPDAIAALDGLIAKLKSDARVSRVSIVGHTDSVGTVQYNQKLSERRAESAKRYLIEHGVEAAQIDTRGEGKLNPAYPNDTAANRKKNRRVDIEFLTIEETTTAPPPEPPKPGLEWVREPVPAPPAWIERALRNPAEHKRTVDVYRFEKTTSTTTLGPKQYVNHPPVARDDSITVQQNSANNPVDVLANDSDPDGDKLTVIAVSMPMHGTAASTGTGATYTPAANYLGTDSFTYTISDGRGGTATATVHVTVTTQNKPPVAGSLSVRVLKETSIDIPVLQAASDPQGFPLTVVSVNHTGPLPNNLVSINPDGTVHYQSVRGWFGQDYFEYTVSDGHGQTATGTVSVYVYELPAIP